MAFTDMNDVEQELGEEKPPKRNGNGNGNRTFLIIAGVLGGIMVLALLCIAGLALYRYIPAQRATQGSNSTQDAQNTAVALAASQTAAIPTATATRQPTYTPTNTSTPTKTPLIVIAPTKSPTHDIAIVTRDYLLTQTAVHLLSSQTATVMPSSTPSTPTPTGLPGTGIAEELGTPGLLMAALVLVVIVFVMRRLRTAS
jgi:cytoskeletal protein RodZ